MKFTFFTLLLFLALVAADEYQLTFNNKADTNSSGLPTVVTIAVYQVYPNMTPEQISVAWKKASAAYNQTTQIRWDINYSTVLSDYSDIGNIGVYTSTQQISANLKDVFQVIDDQVSYNGVIS